MTIKQFFKDIANPQGVAERSNYVFLLSHMRAYTSLLGHILGTNPQIQGYLEMHQSYHSWFGLLKLKYKAKLATNPIDSAPMFVFDKLLHNRHRIGPKIFKRENLKVIIMVREPESTIKSIINMGEKMAKVVAWYRQPDKVVSYYTKRLRRLEKLAKRADGKALFINAQDIIDHTPEVLRAIEEHLQLEQELQPEYNTFSLTGTVGAGDPSSNIKEGKIIKNRNAYENIIIPEQLLVKATTAYQEHLKTMKTLCKLVRIPKSTQ